MDQQTDKKHTLAHQIFNVRNSLEQFVHAGGFAACKNGAVAPRQTTVEDLVDTLLDLLSDLLTGGGGGDGTGEGVEARQGGGQVTLQEFLDVSLQLLSDLLNGGGSD